jgi:hypothetical protein
MITATKSVADRSVGEWVYMYAHAIARADRSEGCEVRTLLTVARELAAVGGYDAASEEQCAACRHDQAAAVMLLGAACAALYTVHGSSVLAANHKNTDAWKQGLRDELEDCFRMFEEEIALQRDAAPAEVSHG